MPVGCKQQGPGILVINYTQILQLGCMINTWNDIDKINKKLIFLFGMNSRVKNHKII